MKIHVNVTPERFVFQSDEKALELDTCIHYLLEGQEVTPVAIGDRVEIPNARFTDLFKSEDPLIDHFYLLRLLLEYGIGKVFEKKFLSASKPELIFHGVEKLHKILGGYQFGIFETAAMQAGARQVEFEQSTGP